MAPLQLYDLVFDPNEACNVVDRPEHAPVVEHLGARLERWMRETGDPLLDGPVAPPPGAETNDPGQRSAGDPARRTDGRPPAKTNRGQSPVVAAGCSGAKL